MKTIVFNLAAVWLLSISAAPLTGCNKDPNFVPRNLIQTHQPGGYANINSVDCQYNLDKLPVESLSDAEKASLLYMREEEKLAHDVYVTLYAKWGLNIFNNIQSSEQTHTDAVLMLLQKYQVPDPAGANGIGVFANADLQTLYHQLIQQGNQSATEALKVGALIEEVDMLDLKNALDSVVNNQDIRLVYENLYRASGNHLRAMVRNLASRGITYVPQRLSQAEYEAIINGGR
ncbi:MAG TPA: DUF2202 domain-containing protein [Saprospiraceae bacterium]|nr:DUF2202 domain-containing protein [Saprospiraceae bacterium]